MTGGRRAAASPSARSRSAPAAPSSPPGTWSGPASTWSSPGRGRRPLPGARRRAGRLGAGADLRRRGRGAAALRGDADPGADRRQRRPRPGRLAGRAGRRRRRARPGGPAGRRVPLVHRGAARARHGAEAIGAAIFRTWVLPFEVLSVLLLAALVGAIVRVPPGHRRGRTPAVSADAPGHPVRHRRAAVRPRRLRRAAPAQRGAAADGRRADAQRGQPDPGHRRHHGARRAAAHRRRSSRCSSSCSPPPRSASAWRSCCSSTGCGSSVGRGRASRSTTRRAPTGAPRRRPRLARRRSRA